MSVRSDNAKNLTFAIQAAGEPLSVKEIIRRHHDALVRFLQQRLRIADDALDIAQEAYIRMMQYESSRHIKSPSSMLYRIAINIANDHGRAEQARRAGRQCDIEELELASDRPSPEREIAASQDLDVLLDVIERLPTKCRHVFLLSRVHQMTYPEIARHCGISVKMVEKHISHALSLCLLEVGERVANTS